jgi:hypothetical protein
MRAEGTSGWFASSHDEFILCMDGKIEVHLVKLASPETAVDMKLSGAQSVRGDVDGRKMGRLILGRGHMGLLPKGAAYRFQAEQPAAAMIQTIDGPLTVQKWSEICQTS